MSHRRRRSILKSSGRNSLVPCGSGDLCSEEDNLTGDFQRAKDVTTSTLTLPFAARKRVSFGHHQIKEFEVISAQEDLATPAPPNAESSEQTLRGPVDMDFSSDDEDLDILKNDLENLPPHFHIKTMDHTKYEVESMLIDATMLDRTFVRFPEPPPPEEDPEIGDKTVWGGPMTVATDLLNQTYAVPPMNNPNKPGPGDNKTLYGGTMLEDPLETTTTFNRTFVKEPQENSLLEIPPETYPEIPPAIAAKVPDQISISRPIPPAAPGISLKVAFSTNPENPLGHDLPLKKPRKELKKSKPGIFGNAVTPKRPLFTNEPERTTKPSGGVSVGMGTETAPPQLNNQQQTDSLPVATRKSFGLQTSFAFDTHIGIDAQTSPFTFDNCGGVFTRSPLRCQNNAPVAPENSPPHIAMISTCMENISISNATQMNESNFENDLATSPPSGQVEESLAELSLHDEPMELSEELEFFLEHSDSLDMMEWILLSRFVKNEVLLLPDHNWPQFVQKYEKAFEKIPGYWQVLLEQRNLLRDFAKNKL